MIDLARHTETVLDALRVLPAPLVTLLVAGLAVLLALIVHRVAMALLGVLDRRSSWLAEGSFQRHVRQPLRALLCLVSLRVVAAAAPERVPAWISSLLTVLLIVSVGWGLARLTQVLEHAFYRQLDLDAADNLRAREIYTQARFLRQLVVIAIFVCTAGAVLLSFDSLRQIGAGLLTSAGVAGIVVGFAAQRAVGNLIAGFQIAFTQPIRTDDVVIVEGEWGRIEEITLTYVVVKIWDERRLVVPIGYFIEHPFQNWTRTSAELLGSVFLYVDYRVPVDELRAEVQRLVEASSHWDKRLWRVHATETGERTLQLRVLVSAANSGDAWELRCELREGLVRYLQQHHPESLPRVRAEVEALRPES